MTSAVAGNMSHGISTATGPGRPEVIAWKARAMTCGASVGCSMRSANFSSVFSVASWSGISCSWPRPRPIMALGTWPVMHITGALTPHAVVSAPMVFITPGPGTTVKAEGLPDDCA